jgi:hypothetical protein
MSSGFLAQASSDKALAATWIVMSTAVLLHKIHVGYPKSEMTVLGRSYVA